MGVKVSVWVGERGQWLNLPHNFYPLRFFSASFHTIYFVTIFSFFNFYNVSPSVFYDVILLTGYKSISMQIKKSLKVLCRVKIVEPPY